MAIIGIAKEDGTQRTVEVTLTGKTAIRVFSVQFDDKDNPIARPLLALEAPGVPLIGDRHPYSDLLFVTRKTAKTLEGLFDYLVACYYSKGTTAGSGSGSENPLNQKPEIEWLFATSNEKIDREINEDGSRGKPITNSSEESFDPPITKDFHDLVLRYVRNEQRFDADQAAQYIGTVNNDNFLGFAPGLVMCTAYNGRQVYREDGSSYWQVIYEFQIRQDSWLRRILDEGTREYYMDGDTLVDEKIKDDDDQPVSQPVKLDGTGRKWTGSAFEGKFLEFNLYKKKPFSALRIEV